MNVIHLSHTSHKYFFPKCKPKSPTLNPIRQMREKKLVYFASIESVGKKCLQVKVKLPNEKQTSANFKSFVAVLRKEII